MATKRDLVEAHAFSRRRLVTAFVSGAPGGREVEPARPGRTIVGGLALGVLLLAGAAVSGVLAGRTQVDWNNPGLVISKEKGQPYVITRESKHPVLDPVINITSARLVLGSSVEPVIVPEKTIQEQTIGPEIGILGAPATVPDTGELVETGWTACTATHHGIRTYVAPSPNASYAEADGFVVQSGGDRYLIATSAAGTGAYRYLLPPSAGGAQDRFLQSVGLGVGNEAVRVPSQWLDLWPAGGDLAWQSLGIPGAAYGNPVSYGAQIHVPQGRVGDLVQVGDVGYLLGPDEPILLSAFAQGVYQASTPPTGVRTFHQPTMDKDSVVSPYAAANWPEGRLTPASGEVCGVLQARPGSRPEIALATDPGDLASAQDVDEGRRDAGVASRAGAYVLSADFTQATRGLPYLVDLKGNSHVLEGVAGERLGYGSYDAPVVPDTWVKLFPTGAVLSPSLALCQPAKTDPQGCS
jgi:Type VII secretion system ESX-1, transport TM domain B